MMPHPDPRPASTRDQIAQNLVFSGPIIVLVLGVLVIVNSQDAGEAARNVMNSVLPLIGTWVGTVLAFYFARENFEAATRNTQSLLGWEEKLRSIPARAVMIPVEKIDRWTLKPGEVADAIRLQSLAEEMKRRKRNRLPVLDARGSIIYVVHLSTVTEFLAGQLLKPAPEPGVISCLTLADLKSQDEVLFQKIQAWVVVRSEASLAEAKSAMENRPNCSDVFLTSTGSVSEPLTGWITNVEISQKARA